jgi:hypothetical protein
MIIVLTNVFAAHQILPNAVSQFIDTDKTGHTVQRDDTHIHLHRDNETISIPHSGYLMIKETHAPAKPTAAPKAAAPKKT